MKTLYIHRDWNGECWTVHICALLKRSVSFFSYMGKYRTDRVHEKSEGEKQRNNCSYLVRDVLDNTFNINWTYITVYTKLPEILKRPNMVWKNILDFHFYPGMAGSFLKLTTTNRFPLFSENMYEIWRIPVVKKEAEREWATCRRVIMYARMPRCGSDFTVEFRCTHFTLPCPVN